MSEMAAKQSRRDIPTTYRVLAVDAGHSQSPNTRNRRTLAIAEHPKTSNTRHDNCGNRIARSGRLPPDPAGLPPGRRNHDARIPAQELRSWVRWSALNAKPKTPVGFAFAARAATDLASRYVVPAGFPRHSPSHSVVIVEHLSTFSPAATPKNESWLRSSLPTSLASPAWPTAATPKTWLELSMRRSAN